MGRARRRSRREAHQIIVFILINLATGYILPCGMYSPDTPHFASNNAVNTLIVSHCSATASYSAASSLRMRR